MKLRTTLAALAVSALLVTVVVGGATAESRPVGAERLAEALAGGGPVIPVLVEITEPVEGAVTLGVVTASGEVKRGEGAELAVVFLHEVEEPPMGKWWISARPLEARPDGSAARVGVSLGKFDELPTSELPLKVLAVVRPPRLADPTTLEPSSERQNEAGAGRERRGVTIHRNALGSLVRVLLWHGELARQGASRPAWWNDAKARFPVGTDPNDFDAMISFVQVAYAEKGRPHRAIRLFEEIAASAGGQGDTGGQGNTGGQGSPAPSETGRLRAWLRACHEIAHLYEGALQDDARSLGWALRCGDAPLSDPVEARQNRIASNLAVARAIEGMERRGVEVPPVVQALTLYRLLARDLLLDPDPYGTLLLPQIFLHMGDLELESGAREAAESAYRAALTAARRLPEGVPSNYRAPGSAAQASLRRLSARGLDLVRVPDGEYRGEAFGYNAPVGVRLSFAGGRCTELHVEDLGDKRPLDAYRVLPERILETQSLEVDAVTGATVTSRAIVSAATDAVFRAVGEPETGEGGTRSDR